MKGLMVKDLRLLLQRKSFFALLIIAAAALGMTDSGTSFLIMYFTIVMSVFVSSTVTYDEYDNCYPFLFTLPVTRKIYAQEKYLFGIVLGLAADIIATCIAVAVTLARGEQITADIFESTVMAVPVFLLVNAVSLPLKLKYGVEKSRTGMMAAGGIVLAAGLFAFKDDGAVLDRIEAVISENAVTVSVIVYAAVIVVEIISYFAGIRIMEKKEL